MLDWLATNHDCHRQLVYGVSIEVHMIIIEVSLAEKKLKKIEASSDMTEYPILRDLLGERGHQHILI